MRIADGGGDSIPPGDPGGITAAAGQLSALAGQISSARAQSDGAASQLTGGSWSSPAAEVFQQASGSYSGDLQALSSAVTGAAGALKTYAAALEAAQAEASSALAAQSQAETTAADAQSRLSATSAPPNASADALTAFNSRQAQASTAVQDVMTQSLNAAGGRLGDAFTRAAGAAAACAGELAAAGSRMAPLARREPNGGAGAHGVANTSGWQDLFKGWFENAGHVNDFLGAGAVSLVHQYDTALEDAGQSALTAWKNLPQDEAGISAVLAEDAGVVGLAAAGDDFEAAVGAYARATNPLTELLTKGLGDDGSALEKVPVLGTLFTLGAIGFNLSEGKPLVTAIGTPVANLAIGGAAAEGMGTLLATDAGAELLASAFIPGVGEVIICGAAAVVVSYAVDKGATFLWDNRAAIGHGIESAVGGVVHLDEIELHYGEVAWQATTSAIGHVATWGVTTAISGLSTAGGALAAGGTTVLHASEAVGTTLLHDANPFNWSFP